MISKLDSQLDGLKILEFKEKCQFEKLMELIDSDIDYDTYNDPYEEQTNKLKEFINLDFIGNGCSRACFKLDNQSIVKIPLNSEGIDCNYYEVELLKLLKKKKLEFLSQYLCPIINYSEGIIISSLCGKIDDLNLINIEEELIMIKSKFAQYGIIFSDLWNHENFGILNNKIVIIDYADWEFEK